MNLMLTKRHVNLDRDYIRKMKCNIDDVYRIIQLTGDFHNIENPTYNMHLESE